MESSTKCSCVPGKDYIGIGVGVLLLNEDRTKTLLILRSANSKNEPHTWSRPGGTIEFGESIEEALRREVREELGIEITNLRQTEILDHRLSDVGQHWVAIGYQGNIAPGQSPSIQEPHKADDLRWFSKDELPENIYSPTRRGIDVWLAEGPEKQG